MNNLLNCKKCKAKCCKVMFLFVGREKPQDRDWIGWINLHQETSIEKKKDGFYLKIKSKCTALKNSKCTIYSNRPKLCRKFDCVERGDFVD